MPLDSVFGIAERISTPISLAAVALFVLFYIYKYISERLPLHKIIGKDAVILLSQIIRFVFILALVAMLIGVGSYLIVLFFEVKKADQIYSNLKLLDSGSLDSRLVAINSILELSDEEASHSAICSGLSSFVRRRAAQTSRAPHRALSDDVQRAVTVLSHLAKRGGCLGIDLSKTDLRRLQLPNGALIEANLAEIWLDEANLANADLTGATMLGASLAETVLRDANLSKTRLNNAIFHSTDLRGADLSDAKGLAGADLLTAKLEGSNLSNVDLRAAKLPPGPLLASSLQGADLREADLTRTIVCGTTLRGAKIDATTKLPMEHDC